MNKEIFMPKGKHDAIKCIFVEIYSLLTKTGLILV